MHELYERDKKIVNLTNANANLKTENEELESISQNYYEVGGPLTSRSGLKHNNPAAQI